MKTDYKKNNITGLSNAIDMIGVLKRHLDDKNFDRFLAAIDRGEYIQLPQKVVSEILDETTTGRWIQGFQQEHKSTLDIIFSDDIPYIQLVLNIAIRMSVERLKESRIVSYEN